ncbi:MAG: DNA ligase [Tyzzerella sp.]|nr:DNA ligase [Tyzzerella sp.]
MDIFDGRRASPMLIAEQMQAFDDPNWLYELKLDGFRCLAYVDNSMVDLRNKRNVRMLPKFPELKDIGKNVKGRCILDGEIVVMVNSVPDFYRLQKRTLLTDKFKIDMEGHRYPAAFVAFDCLYADGKELVWATLMERKKVLADLIVEGPRLAISRYVEQSGTALYQLADESRLEGVVAKRKDSFYWMGKRSKDWVKFKRMADEEFVVAGYIPKGKHIYSLVIAKYRGTMLVYKGHVTAGVTRETVEALEVTGRNPFTLLPMIKEDVIWVKPSRVCVVEYMPNLNQALRQPVFKGLRNDVVAEEVQG